MDQFNQAPAPTQEEFVILKNKVTQIYSETLSAVTIGNGGIFPIRTGGVVFAVQSTSHPYYTVTLYKGGANSWYGCLTSAADGSHPSSGTFSGTYYYFS
jgi:hypothetical protein